MTATAVIRGDASGIISPAAAIEPLAQTFFRAGFGHLFKRKSGAKADTRGSGLVCFNPHLSSHYPFLRAAKEIDLVAFF